MATYVAAAETCPLLVRWAPKCICMHLSRQQRSGWKQNHAQEDTCSWANPLVTAKGGVKWTEYSHLRISSSYCSPEERSLSLVQTWASQILLRSAARSDQAISIQSGDAQQLHRGKKKLAFRAASRAAAVNSTALCDRENQSSAASLWVVSNTTADPALRVFTSRRWFLLCALTCTDARGPVFTPTQLQLVVLDFTSYWLVTSRIEFWLVFINALCLLLTTVLAWSGYNVYTAG